jgi:hypothetical protein
MSATKTDKDDLHYDVVHTMMALEEGDIEHEKAIEQLTLACRAFLDISPKVSEEPEAIMSALGNWTDADQERFAELLWAKAEEKLKGMSRDDILSMIVHGESGLIELPVAELTANLMRQENVKVTIK